MSQNVPLLTLLPCEIICMLYERLYRPIDMASLLLTCRRMYECVPKELVRVLLIRSRYVAINNSIRHIKHFVFNGECSVSVLISNKLVVYAKVTTQHEQGFRFRYYDVYLYVMSAQSVIRCYVDDDTRTTPLKEWSFSLLPGLLNANTAEWSNVTKYVNRRNIKLYHCLRPLGEYNAINGMPNEILEMIYSCLWRPRDIIGLSLTCRLMQNSMPREQSRLLSVWKLQLRINESIKNIKYYIAAPQSNNVNIEFSARISDKLVINHLIYIIPKIASHNIQSRLWIGGSNSLRYHRIDQTGARTYTCGVKIEWYKATTNHYDIMKLIIPILKERNIDVSISGIVIE